MPTKKKNKLLRTAKVKKAAKAKLAPAKAQRKTKAVVAKLAAPASAVIKPKEQVAVSKAKGRPMLAWVGKRPLRAVTAFPAQYVESFATPGADKMAIADATIWKDWPGRYSRGGLLFHGDNKEVLAHLLANGFRNQVHLICIDPPFDSGADYVRKVTLRGVGGTAKLDGETYSLGEQIQYTDIWANDNYLQFMYERVLLLKELLSDGGSIYLHCDPRRSAFLRLVLDEVFGPDNFQSEIIWQRTNAHNMPSRTFARSHDSILFYTKGNVGVFNEQTVPVSEAQLKRYEPDEQGRLYTGQDLTYSTVNVNRHFEWRGTKPPPNRSWGFSIDELERLWSEGLILTKKDGTPRLDGLKVYYDPKKGKPVGSVWADVDRVGNTSAERLDYPTQKPEALLDRIVKSSSNPGDIVLDCFIGSGTAAAVAQKLGRRWIGCDINKGAVQTTAKRLQVDIAGQVASAQQHELPVDDKVGDVPPAQFAFAVYRVNDYDLAIQHNEAVNLACEHIGVTRTLGDAFFDGTLGNRLVKIVPFGHPLSPVDLEDVKRELEARATESRDLTVVCLGKELSVDVWLADWNRLRKQGNAPNKIEIIELRTDPKYGKFIAHQPAQARVDIRRVKGKESDKLLVEVKDFISPTIIERLQGQGGLLAPKIPDWRAMVDTVMIDPAYNGEFFNIALFDVPERKQDYVQARYELPAPAAETTVAVKITDMLGEEVIKTATV